MSSQPSMTRRGVLGAAGLLVLASGCDSARTQAKTPPTAIPSGDVDPDVQTAAATLVQVGMVRDQVRVARQRFPGLAGVLAPVAAMHEAHYQQLDGAVSRSGVDLAHQSPPALPTRRPAALRQLAALERSLSSTLVAAALKAESGAFARLLASMGAAIDQRLAEWPR